MLARIRVTVFLNYEPDSCSLTSTKRVGRDTHSHSYPSAARPHSEAYGTAYERLAMALIVVFLFSIGDAPFMKSRVWNWRANNQCRYLILNRIAGWLGWDVSFRTFVLSCRPIDKFALLVSINSYSYFEVLESIKTPSTPTSFGMSPSFDINCCGGRAYIIGSSLESCA